MKYILLLLLYSLSACDVPEKKESANENKNQSFEEGEKKNTPVINDEIETNSEAQILNNIIVHESGGLKAGRVYLAFERGSLVPKTNRTEVGITVYLVISVKHGWYKENGLVSFDASQKIITDKGELVANVTSLFKNTPPVDQKDALQINLKATITKTRKDIDYYIVNYRLWDKKSEGEIKGSYKLYVENRDE